MSLGEVTIRFAESAVADLEEIRLWYADQGVPDVGERLIADIFQRVEALGKHPELGRIVPEFDQPFFEGADPAAFSYRLSARSGQRSHCARLAQ
jgi:plasmid stabilization system protein ParE